MNEDEKYIADSIKTWVWSGFYSAEEMNEMLEDIIEDDCDVIALKALIPRELQFKFDTERFWPQVTDCDRLDSVFYALHEAGICALSNAGYTMSDGYSEVAQAIHEAPEGHYHGYCFYHGQDVERVVEGSELMIAFGSLDDDPVHGVKVGQTVCAALKTAGFQVAWNESDEQRIEIHAMKWQRRLAQD
ncbi:MULTISPECIES: DUF6891 domain-containing protein [Pseudomonas syringae group]|uniref:DUF6891 domain-containing protein n=1 Tax=Pseudomonas syringae group TaxID=136849 RepID=UPI0006D5FEE1|nr:MULTISPECIES: hypothetical protein [Pseudomonas syringae group]KPX34310.1 Uncharacterized protein ALO77_02023 [Pseudomonas coronafaciens pv. garcae]MCF5715097.1 hypothetical protein [Pseudomonas tremae]RMP26130.1 hypothetical protein ALQ25_00205 [Pseudomonas coronafaciens pv. atropurpurea]RMS88787.1 hypothetical protein ALP57_01207 [Pseudomonas coronafaciens pv. oryzae]RMS97435.1 hypothetical protein ALP56_03166 [Pseudomonas coronafaciens pv. oryzae]